MTTPLISRQTIDFLSYGSTVISIGSLTNNNTISFYDKNNSSGLQNITYTNSTSNLSISSNYNNTSINLNVGINTLSPAYNLDVSGNLNMFSNIYIANTNLGNLQNTSVFNSITVNNNIYSTSINASNIGAYRNRIINGNMVIDTLNSANNPIIIRSSRDYGLT